MADLTAKDRKDISSEEFAVPPKDGKPGAYPVPDKEHAALAKSGASHAEHVGNISKSEEEEIDKKADEVLADEAVDLAAHEAATSTMNDKASPSDAQLMAGNYQKGHIKVGPLHISVENPSGSRRRQEWPPLSDHYGYIKGTKGHDKDHIDAFVKPGTDEDHQGPVHVVNQNHPDGSFDEHKAMVGWPDASTAKAGYLSNYMPNQEQNIHSVVSMPMDEFHAWAKSDAPSQGPCMPAQPVAHAVADCECGCGGKCHEVAVDEELEVVADCFAPAEFEIVQDSAREGVLGVVKQPITRANFKTKNGYIYRSPGPLDKALVEANDRFKLKTIHTEKHHPALIQGACDSNGCGPKFANNFANVTGTPLRVEGPDAAGWVYGYREIVDSPDGRSVFQAIKDGKPMPVSVRWLFKANPLTKQPDVLHLVTWDDVLSPAVHGAGSMAVIMDDFEDPGSMTDPRPEDKDGLGEPFYGVNRNTVNPYDSHNASPEVDKIAADASPAVDGALEAHSKGKPKMNETLKTVRAFVTAATTGAPKAELLKTVKAATGAILDAYNEGDPEVPAYVKSLLSGCKVVADSMDAAYHSGVKGPVVELGNMIGADPTVGWGPDLRDVPDNDNKTEMRNLQQKTSTAVKGLEITADEEAQAAETKRVEDVEAKMDEFIRGGHPISMMDKDIRGRIAAHVKRVAKDADDVKAVLDEAVKPFSRDRAVENLIGLGFTGVNVLTTTVTDEANPSNVTNVREVRPGMAAVDRYLAAMDESLKKGPMANDGLTPNFNDPSTLTRRTYNRRVMDPILDECFDIQYGTTGGLNAISDSSDPWDTVTKELNAVAQADSYTSALAQVPNQPTIYRAMLTQAFQDQKALKFAGAVGPGQAGKASSGWEVKTGFGRVFKVPYESYTDPTAYGFQYGGLDFGLTNPENAGVYEGTVDYFWDTFFPLWRSVATSSTIQAIKSIGNGPLNLDLNGRNIWHSQARKSRTIDMGISNEMFRVALEYAVTAKTNETYTSGNNGLANQTVFGNGASTVVPGQVTASVIVNLNPTKIASAAVAFTSGAPTDDYAIYPNPNVTPSGSGVIPIGAVRLLAGAAVGVNSGTYFGTNGQSKNPVVPPRAQLTLTSGGADSNSTLNPISVSAPAGAVLGYLGSDGYIYSSPGTSATYAVDYMNGVIVFASGVSQNSNVLGTTITASYSYSTNFDVFPLQPSINGLAGLATGETPPAFMARFLAQFDFTAGNMAAWPRFVAPDMALMSTTISPNITEATTFYKLNSPDGTDLYPDEEFFAIRNGVAMARTNTPLFVGDTGILLTRRFSTKYVIDTPYETRGPVVKYDSNGNVIPGEAYYGAENSAICTPQVKNSVGTLINPVGRILLTLQGGKQSCGLPN